MDLPCLTYETVRVDLRPDQLYISNSLDYASYNFFCDVFYLAEQLLLIQR